LLLAAAAVLDAIQEGQLSHIFLIGGCDAPEPSRKYYTEVVKGLPQDTMVLTLGCGKYRFYDQDLGTLANGLPRLLDMGQCNDAYSALVVATVSGRDCWCGSRWWQLCFVSPVFLSHSKLCRI
jgi:hydroxylamine reductase (hybrid-cluster protein)